MCLIVFAYRVHPGYSLVAVANRDEFHHRPASRLGPWSEYPDIIAGRDLEQGGTWMGVTRNGRWSAVTNFREPERAIPDCVITKSAIPQRDHAYQSRGHLCSQFLQADMPGMQYLAKVADTGDQYRGFNLLVFDGETLSYFSNRGAEPCQLQPGIYTLSNHLLDTAWPKTRKVFSGMQAMIEQETIQHRALCNLMNNREPVEDGLLPDTGMEIDLERFLAPCFIVGEQYGTRNTTSLTLDKQGMLTFVEQSWNSSGERQFLETYQGYITGPSTSA